MKQIITMVFDEKEYLRTVEIKRVDDDGTETVVGEGEAIAAAVSVDYMETVATILVGNIGCIRKSLRVAMDNLRLRIDNLSSIPGITENHTDN